MIPVQSYSTVLQIKMIISKNRKTRTCILEALKIGYYPVSRLAGIDIDEEEDFLLVEKIILSNKVKNSKPKYYK